MRWSTGNLIGTNGDGVADSAERNVISGNDLEAIVISNEGTTGNVVAGNYIGTDPTGITAIANGTGSPTTSGVRIALGADDNLIGSNGDGMFDTEERNVISGNSGHGIALQTALTSNNVIRGNYIGTNASGTGAVPNTQNGIDIDEADGTIVDGNVISGNDRRGFEAAGSDDVITGNVIGLASDGVSPLGNSVGAIQITGSNITLGGVAADTANVIAANASGVGLVGATNIQILDNFIGTDSLGTVVAGQASAIQNAGSEAFVSGALTVNGTIEFDATSTLSGIGSISGSVTANGIVAPGESPGILNTGDFTFGDGSTFEVEIGGTTAGNTDNDHDQLNVTGTVTIGANVTLTTLQWLTYTPSLGEFTIINNDGTDPVTGTFDGLPEGAQISNFMGLGDVAEITYVGGDGNDVVITHVGNVQTVVNTNDTGPGSLRQAILNANASTGFDTIQFDIPGDGPHTIRPQSNYPDILGPVLIDGYSQTGAVENTGVEEINAVLQVELDGQDIVAAANGLTLGLGSDNSTIRGLAIHSFNSGGASAIIVFSDDNRIEGNFIGTDITGTARLSNQENGVSIRAGASGNFVGTNGDGINDVAERNLISGNPSGVRVNGAGADGNVIAGNLIGTDITGTVSLFNTTGITIFDGPDGTIVGTNGDGVSDAIERNIISGNTGGLVVGQAGANTTNTVIAGNYIGTTADGFSSLPNSLGGISLNQFATSTIVGTDGSGGFHDARRNIISGNSATGVALSSGNGNTVAGNYIGTNPLGTGAIPNQNGVILSGSASNNIVGTNGDGVGDEFESNLISGNSNHGILFQATPSSNEIAGNLIGTEVTGTGPLGNGFAGITLLGGSNNLIGTNGDGQSDALEANTIAFNTLDGIDVSAGTGNRISENSIFANGDLGIDLGNDGPTANDGGDADPGANNLQNTPIITNAAFDGDDLDIDFSVDSDPINAAYPIDIEFFVSEGGEGKQLIATGTYTAGSFPGTASLALIEPAGLLPGQEIVATATDAVRQHLRVFRARGYCVVAARRHERSRLGRRLPTCSHHRRQFDART